MYHRQHGVAVDSATRKRLVALSTVIYAKKLARGFYPFPKGKPCFTVEGTPKGVQKRYARFPNLLCGFHVTNYVLGSHPQKTYFSHSC